MYANTSGGLLGKNVPKCVRRTVHNGHRRSSWSFSAIAQERPVRNAASCGSSLQGTSNGLVLVASHRPQCLVVAGDCVRALARACVAGAVNMKPSQNERNMPYKHYTPGLSRDVPSPGENARSMLAQECTARKKGCTGEAIISKRNPDSHTYVHLCPSCAGYTKE